MSQTNTIVKVAVYPPIGIARVGNSPEYFLAPELPGKTTKPVGGYKDSQGRVKKQVVRFRIYGLDQEGNVVKELTEDDADITWRVHVANRKAAWYQFMNALDLEGLAIPGGFRNADISDRSQLVIDPGSRTISGRNVQGPQYLLDSGQFMGTEVPLGQLQTDDKGRLLFFGGDGHSASYDGKPATTFANNDGWHDDVSDGPVRATVIYEGHTMEATPAMVTVTPPNFGQGLYGVVSMYDVVLDLFIRSGWLPAPAQPNFWTHIYPIFNRLSLTQWVNSGFSFLFGQNSPSDPNDPAILAQLADPSESARSVREWWFAWFRDPASTVAEPTKIPPFYGDAFGDYTGVPQDDLALTRTQYAWMQQWADGNFDTVKPPDVNNFDDLTPAQQVEALNITPLDDCLGGPFHPGIELTWPLRNLLMWEAPYRLKVLPEGDDPSDNYGPLLAPAIALAPGGPLDGSGPGTLTRYMGVPWQTDEASCLSGYNPSYYLPLPSFWAARVPNQVMSEDSFMRLIDPNLNLGQRLKHFDYRQDWLRDLGTQYTTRINNMVREWWELGIIAEHEAPTDLGTPYLPQKMWLETDRGPFVTADPTYAQVLHAEHADQVQVLAAQELVVQQAAKAPEERPKRRERVFSRDQR